MIEVALHHDHESPPDGAFLTLELPFAPIVGDHICLDNFGGHGTYEVTSRTISIDASKDDGYCIVFCGVAKADRLTLGIPSKISRERY